MSWVQAREVFGAIAAAAAVAILAPEAAPAVMAWRSIQVAATVYTILEARRQKQNPDESKMRQDQLTLKSAESPRLRVYGEQRVGGTLVYWTTHGPDNRILSMVIVLADHPCESIEDVLFDDKSLGTLSGDGHVQSGSPWYKENKQLITANAACVDGRITLPYRPLTNATLAIRDGTTTYQYTPAGDAGDATTLYLPTTLTAGVDYTHTAPDTTITLTGDYAGKSFAAEDVFVSFQADFGKPLARVRKYLGANPATADATLITDSAGEWSTSCRLDNQCYIIVDIEWDETVAAAGIPNVSAIVRGAKIYNNRTGVTAYSNNWADVVADYLKWQFGATNAEIESADWNASANTADQDVTVDDGTVKRYTINRVISTAEEPATVLSDLLLAGGAGVITWASGKWRILCGAYRSPVSITLSDGDMTAPATIRQNVPRKEKFNEVRGTYFDNRAVDGARLYTRTSYTPYQSAAYVEEDNNEVISRTIDFSAVTDYRVAHRLAKQIMHRARQSLRVTASFSLKAVPLQVGDVVTCNFARYGFVDKNFEILERAFTFPNSVELTLQEITPEVFDWDYHEVAYLDPSPNTQLQDPTYVEQPVLTLRSSAVADANGPATLDVLPDGTLVPYVQATWPARTVASEYVQIRWKRPWELAFRTINARIGETSAKIEGVSGGDVLQIVAVAINAIGARSDEWIVQEFIVDPNLPKYTGKAPVVSANLLSNATFTSNVSPWKAAWTTGSALFSHEATYSVAGSPSSAIIIVQSSAIGNGNTASVRSNGMACKPGQRWCAYVDLIAYGTTAYASLAWYDSAGGLIRVDPTNAVAGPLTNTLDKFVNAANYERARVFATAPAGAATAQMYIYADSSWAAVPEKYVSVHKPFAGIVPDDATEEPAWDPGGANPVDTPLIVPGAVTQIVIYTDLYGRAITLDTLQFVAIPLGSITAKAAGDLVVQCSCEIQASSQGGQPSTLSVGISFDSKREAVVREVMTVQSGETKVQGTTVIATKAGVAAGETVTPSLWVSRTRYGLGVGNVSDLVRKIDAALKLVKA